VPVTGLEPSIQSTVAGTKDMEGCVPKRSSNIKGSEIEHKIKDKRDGPGGGIRCKGNYSEREGRKGNYSGRGGRKGSSGPKHKANQAVSL